MLCYSRRRHYFLLLAIVVSISIIYRSNRIEIDEKRIQKSLLNELPILERRIRDGQANLSSLRMESKKMSRLLTKYSWQVKRLIYTIDEHEREEKEILPSKPFDFDLPRLQDREKNTRPFRLYFHRSNTSNPMIQEEFYSRIANISTPYLTDNQTEAYLNLLYLPIQSNEGDFCRKTSLDRNWFLLYEFFGPIDDKIDESCFPNNSLSVKFFDQMVFDSSMMNKEFSWIKRNQSIPLAIIYLDKNCECDARCSSSIDFLPFSDDQ